MSQRDGHSTSWRNNQNLHKVMSISLILLCFSVWAPQGGCQITQGCGIYGCNTQGWRIIDSMPSSETGPFSRGLNESWSLSLPESLDARQCISPANGGTVPIVCTAGGSPTVSIDGTHGSIIYNASAAIGSPVPVMGPNGVVSGVWNESAIAGLYVSGAALWERQMQPPLAAGASTLPIALVWDKFFFFSQAGAASSGATNQVFGYTGQGVPVAQLSLPKALGLHEASASAWGAAPPSSVPVSGSYPKRAILPVYIRNTTTTTTTKASAHYRASNAQSLVLIAVDFHSTLDDRMAIGFISPLSMTDRPVPDMDNHSSRPNHLRQSIAMRANPTNWAVAQPVTFSSGSDARSLTVAATITADDAVVDVAVWEVNVSFVEAAASDTKEPPVQAPLAMYPAPSCSSTPSDIKLAIHAALYPAPLPVAISGTELLSVSSDELESSLWVTVIGTGKTKFSTEQSTSESCTGISVLTGLPGNRSWATAQLAMSTCEGRSWESYEILSPPLIARNTLESNSTSLFVTASLTASDGYTMDAVLGVATMPSPAQIALGGGPPVLHVSACAAPASRDKLGSQPIVAVAAEGQGVSQLIIGGLHGVYAFGLV